MFESYDGITFEVCQPVEEQALQIMNWRNDPVTLSFFFHRTPKIWPDFWHEYRDSYFQHRPELAPVFALADGKRVAFLRFAPHPHPSGTTAPTVDISINLPPESRGQGLGRKVLRAVAGYLKAQGVHSIYAEVVTENLASIKAFKAAGFEPIGNIDRLVEDTAEVFNVDCFVMDMVPAGAAGQA